MNKAIKKSVAVLLALIFSLSSLMTIGASALDVFDEIASIGNELLENKEAEQVEEERDEAGDGKFVITAPKTIIQDGEKVTLTANAKNVSWSTSDRSIATVNTQGVVTGKKQGRATITASATVNGKKATASVEINVTLKNNLALDFLTKYSLLSYNYSYRDNYFYTNKDNAWQHNFGYSALYDLAAPYILLEYDYVRVHFNYEGKDWMIQLWKGQYGMVFYGCECGVYCKPHSDKEDTAFTFYQCAEKEDRLKMQTSLYRDKSILRTGNYEHEFTTPYESTWWSTGFKPGHLNIEEPANELRQTGIITLKDKNMTKLFADGLKECGFKQVSSKDKIVNDSFYVDGNNVTYQWQEISEAENTMGIKIAGGTLIAANALALLFAALIFFGMFGGLFMPLFLI